MTDPKRCGTCWSPDPAVLVRYRGLGDPWPGVCTPEHHDAYHDTPAGADPERIRAGEADVEAGRTTPAEDTFNRLRSKYPAASGGDDTPASEPIRKKGDWREARGAIKLPPGMSSVGAIRAGREGVTPPVPETPTDAASEGPFKGSPATSCCQQCGNPHAIPRADCDTRVAKAVRKEMERIAKIMCEQCSQGLPLEDGGRYHQSASKAHVAPKYLRRCDAAAIRAQPATAS